MLWEIDIHPAPGMPNRLAQQVAADAAEFGIAANLKVTAANGYLVQGDLQPAEVNRLARELFADRVVERATVAKVADSEFANAPTDGSTLVQVLRKPGVMDPVAQSVQTAIADFGYKVDVVRTLRKFWLTNLPSEKLSLLATKVLANDAIEQVIVGPLTFDRLDFGGEYQFKLITVPLRSMTRRHSRD